MPYRALFLGIKKPVLKTTLIEYIKYIIWWLKRIPSKCLLQFIKYKQNIESLKIE